MLDTRYTYARHLTILPATQGGYDAGYLYQCSMEGAGLEPEPYEAPHSIPVPAFDGKDLPLHSLSLR